MGGLRAIGSGASQRVTLSCLSRQMSLTKTEHAPSESCRRMWDHSWDTGRQRDGGGSTASYMDAMVTWDFTLSKENRCPYPDPAEPRWLADRWEVSSLPRRRETERGGVPGNQCFLSKEGSISRTRG